jgi:hypothetical protein
MSSKIEGVRVTVSAASSTVFGFSTTNFFSATKNFLENIN